MSDVPGRRPKLTVRTERSDEPIDMDAWLREYVRFVLELEGIRTVAPPPAARLG